MNITQEQVEAVINTLFAFLEQKANGRPVIIASLQGLAIVADSLAPEIAAEVNKLVDAPVSSYSCNLPRRK